MTPWTATCQASLSLTISQSLPKIMSIELVLSSNHLILSSPIYPLPSIFTSIRAFSNEITVCIRWPKYWNFSISPSNEYSRLISFKIDWFDLLPVQETLKSLLQHQFESINSLAFCVLCGPALTSVHDYCKDHNLNDMDLSQQSDVFNTLSRFLITFPPRINHLLISCLQLPSTGTLEPKKRKCVTASTFSASICHEAMGSDAMILVFFLILSFKLTFSPSSFSLIKRLFHSSLLSAIRVVSSPFLRLLIFLPTILIPARNTSSLAFCMMCSVCKLNKQVTINSLAVLLSQSWTSLFSIQGSDYCFLIHIRVSQETGKMVFLRVFHSLLWFTELKASA